MGGRASARRVVASGSLVVLQAVARRVGADARRREAPGEVPETAVAVQPVVVSASKVSEYTVVSEGGGGGGAPPRARSARTRHRGSTDRVRRRVARVPAGDDVVTGRRDVDFGTRAAEAAKGRQALERNRD